MTLEFDAERHEYRLDGRKIPSVTQILPGWRKVKFTGSEFFANEKTGHAVSAETLTLAGDVGTAAHKAMLAMAVGCNPVWDAFGDEDQQQRYTNVLAGLGQFFEEHSPKPEYCESRVWSRLGYAGTLDLVCTIGKRLYLLDLKTGAHEYVGPQTRAYETAWREQTKARATLTRAVLYVPKDGKPYQLKELRDDATDEGYFRARLALLAYNNLLGEGDNYDHAGTHEFD